MLSPLNRLNSDFARIFGGGPVHIVEVVPNFVAVDQDLDPASQTDFVLPVDSLLQQAVDEMAEISALAERVIAGTATEADKARLHELSQPVETETEAEDEADDVTVYDLTDEDVRIYHFPDKTEVEVDNPHTLTIGDDGTHFITPYDRVGIQIPPRWVRLEVFPKQGEACFLGHPPANEIG